MVRNRDTLRFGVWTLGYSNMKKRGKEVCPWDPAKTSSEN